ncbi:MAG: hypothetical protein GC136_03415, partial [Alphaproteobacteria bacterium]|nr:hypothetical protein [Alphaproteobacteria bacterium]
MDHLRTFPLPQQPESWELNETFLSILERECEKWDGSALALQFGNEINFKFLTFDDTAKLIEKHGSLENARVEARKASANGAAMMLDIYESCGGAPHGMDFFSNKIQELCRYIETNTVQLESYFGWEAENMCAHLQEIMLDLQSPEGEISDRAKQNTFLAWLHIMPSAVGGLRDLIEPRFGDFTWGQGWWDEPSEAEVRVAVPPFNPDEAMWDRVSAGITNYHRVWENIFAAAKEFRILTTNSHGYNHLHISFWNKQDSTNLITMQDDLEIADALHHLYIGYVAACANLPMLVQETVNPKYAHGTEFVPNIGTARTDAIRQRENTWEFRHDYTSANFHMARYLVPIMAGIRTGLLYDIKLGDDRPEFKPSIQPVLTHAHDEKSPLRNVLSHCIITEDGHLKVDWDSMTATHGLLMAELGKVFGKNYKTIIGD